MLKGNAWKKGKGRGLTGAFAYSSFCQTEAPFRSSEVEGKLREKKGGLHRHGIGGGSIIQTPTNSKKKKRGLSRGRSRGERMSLSYILLLLHETRGKRKRGERENN